MTPPDPALVCVLGGVVFAVLGAVFRERLYKFVGRWLADKLGGSERW